MLFSRPGRDQRASLESLLSELFPEDLMAYVEGQHPLELREPPVGQAPTRKLALPGPPTEGRQTGSAEQPRSGFIPWDKAPVAAKSRSRLPDLGSRAVLAIFAGLVLAAGTLVLVNLLLARADAPSGQEEPPRETALETSAREGAGGRPDEALEGPEALDAARLALEAEAPEEPRLRPLEWGARRPLDEFQRGQELLQLDLGGAPRTPGPQAEGLLPGPAALAEAWPVAAPWFETHDPALGFRPPPAPSRAGAGRLGQLLAQDPGDGPATPRAPEREQTVPTGTLLISVLPWAQVYLDDRHLGELQGPRFLTLPVGDHRVRLEGHQRTGHCQVTVKAGEQVDCVRDLGATKTP
jgi:hypothetical protein